MLEPTWIAVALLALALLLALDDWRTGFLLVIPMGFLQDPLRKLAAGQPAYFLTLAAGVFVFTFLSMWASGVPIRMSYLYGRDRRLERAWKAFIVLVALQAIHALVRYRSPVVFGLGLANYLAPIAALMVAFLYASTQARAWRFLRLYLCFAVPWSLTVYLSYWFGQDWDVLKDIGAFTGQQMVIYAMDTAFYSYPGFFRVGEIAAWHAATASALLIVIATRTKNPATRLAVGLLVIALVGAVLLTGRRKMLMALTLFGAFYAFFLTYFWGGTRRVSGVIVAMALAATVFVSASGDSADLYLRRGATVFEEADDRLTVALDLVDAAVSRQGWLGAGAGVAAQGTQYYGSGADVGGAAESGFGRIATELGVAGVAVTAWVAFALARYLSSVFRRIPRRLSSITPLMAGFAALVLANGATFLVATQLYGDLFILILLGSCTGFLLAGEQITRERLVHEAQLRRRYEKPAPAPQPLSPKSFGTRGT